jgi:nucleoid-associated protein YgaU
MAIAAWETDPAPDEELPWPKPALRLLRDDTPAVEVEEDPADSPAAVEVASPPPLHERLVDPVAEAFEEPCVIDQASEWVLAVAPRRLVVGRRRAKAARVRRRRAAVLAVAGGIVVLLALPLGALGAQAVPSAHGAALQPGTAYTVQQGDTLWSIASRVSDSGDPTAVMAELATRIGSTTVVPGERILLPAAGG